MNIVICHSTNFDFKTELYAPIKNFFDIQKHNVYLPEESKAKNTLELIKDCDFIIAEVSFASTGEGIELGWANILNKQIYCIHKTNHKPSSSLKFITKNFYEYSNSNELIKIIKQIINTHK